MIRRLGPVIFSCIVASPCIAKADTFSIFGAGPQGVAEVGARVAQSDSAWAAFDNPGGLALAEKSSIQAGIHYSSLFLKAAGQNQSLESPTAGIVGLNAKLPFTGALRNKIHLGLALSQPGTTLAHVRTHTANEPVFPYYDNRTQRTTLIPGLSLAPNKYIGVGISFNVLAGVVGNADTRSGTSTASEPRLDQSATTIVSPIVGIQFRPTDSLRVGFVYRHKFNVPVDITTQSTLGGLPVEANVTQKSALFDPTTWAFGVAWAISKNLWFEIDTQYIRWGQYQGPSLDLVATLPAVNASSPPQPRLYRSIAAYKGAANYTIALSRNSLTISAGLGLEPAMLSKVDQSLTNQVDGDKIMTGLGAIFSTYWGLLATVGIQTHLLQSTSLQKKACSKSPCAADTVVGPDSSQPDKNITDPGYPTLKSNGAVLSAAATLGYSW